MSYYASHASVTNLQISGGCKSKEAWISVQDVLPSQQQNCVIKRHCHSSCQWVPNLSGSGVSILAVVIVVSYYICLQNSSHLLRFRNASSWMEPQHQIVLVDFRSHGPFSLEWWNVLDAQIRTIGHVSIPKTNCYVTVVRISVLDFLDSFRTQFLPWVYPKTWICDRKNILEYLTCPKLYPADSQNIFWRRRTVPQMV